MMRSLACSVLVSTGLLAIGPIGGAAAQELNYEDFRDRCLDNGDYNRLQDEGSSRIREGRGRGRGQSSSGGPDRIPPGQLVAAERMSDQGRANSQAYARWFGGLSSTERRRYREDLRGASEDYSDINDTTAGRLARLAELMGVDTGIYDRPGCDADTHGGLIGLLTLQTQSDLEEQQDQYNTMSANQRLAHDAAMAVIRNIGG